MCRRNDVDASETVAYGFVTGLSLSLNDRVSMFGLVLDNRSRWHGSIGGLLAAVMLACPFACRAGACCSGELAESVSDDVDETSCRHWEKSRQSPALPVCPEEPVRDGRCLCTGVMLSEVATAPRQTDGSSCHKLPAALSACRAVSSSRDTDWGQETRTISGRAICCANGVLNC